MIWVPTEDLIYKNLTDHLPRGTADGEWDIKGRVTLASTHKHRSIYQRFVQGAPWEETDLFTDLYTKRFLPHDPRGYQDKLRRCRTTLEDTFIDLGNRGFRTDVDLPVVVIGREGTIMLWNQGNHRVAMAKVLKIKSIPCAVRTRHGQWQWLREQTGVVHHPDRL